MSRSRYIPISVAWELTLKCNLRCIHCGSSAGSIRPNELTTEESLDLCKKLNDLDVQLLTFTGGEPLLRGDIVEIIEKISSHVEEVSMTTNGYLLAQNACKLKDVGLDRVNISFHSKNPDVFCKIIGSDSYNMVIEGIKVAKQCGLNPVKLNMVVMKGINEDEIPQMIAFSRENGVTLQLIEYQPLEKGVTDWSEYHFDLKPLEKDLEARSTKVVEREMHRRRQYHLSDGGVVEIVRPMHNSTFCQYCTRLRLTSDGFLKPCLMREDNHVEAVTLLRNGGDRESIKKAFIEAVANREPYWG